MSKKFSKITVGIILIISLLSLCSCATAITKTKFVEPYKFKAVYDEPLMDFIGYKVDTNILSTASSSKISTGVWKPNVDVIMSEFDQAKAIATTRSLRQLGYRLESSKIAVNKADSYFGIYSLQEMELYKTDKKYVTFVEVAKSKLDYKDNKESKNIFGGIAGGLIGAGVPFAILGAVERNQSSVEKLAKFYMGYGIGCSVVGAGFLIPALIPTKTEISFSGIYNIYIYDSVEKSLIRKEPVYVYCNTTFNGSYTYDEASKEVVREYISENVSNKILGKYDEINSWLANR